MSESVAHDQLRAFIERVERLDEELKSINDDKKEIFAEAKGNGFDVKAMKVVLQRRRMDVSARMELEALVDLYMSALGMLPADEETNTDRSCAPAPARTREIIEEFDAESGNLTESRPRAAQTEPVPPPVPPSDAVPGTVESTAQRLPETEAPYTVQPVDLGNVTPIRKKVWKHTDPAHPDCLDAAQCGGFSNLGLCQSCKAALAGDRHEATG